MENRVLIIDDDVQLRLLLRECLAHEGIAADLAGDGREGFERISAKEYQVVVLDIMLPGQNGFEILTELRKTHTVPVLMLTARGDEVDKISGLRLGADDYLTKPFSMNEFIVRVQSLIRRYTVFNTGVEQISDVISFGTLRIDRVGRTVTLLGKNIEMTSKEFDLLELMASNPGKVYTKRQIYNAVWQDEYAFDDGNIMAYMSKLRKKLAAAGEECPYIQTVWGVGYRFRPEVDA